MSDVKLDGVKVVLESEGWTGGNLILDGPLLKARTWDFWLSHPARLTPGTPSDAARRALVHTFSDGVGINVNEDYPGGVEIGGNVKITRGLNVSTINPIDGTFVEIGEAVQIYGNILNVFYIESQSGVLSLEIDTRDPEGGKLILNGVDLRAQIRDLDIDHPPRRVNNLPRRRAIVHAEGDALGININEDYPGGVEIGGNVKIKNFCYVSPGYAELVALPPGEDPRDFDQGDVFVISDLGDRTVEIANERSSSKVVGIFNDTFGVLGTRDPTQNIGFGEIPITVGGIVSCKVTAMGEPDGNGPIKRGDLLTTSGIQGHAMKAIDPKPGTILGKAFGELENGSGIIDVLVMLQ